MPRTGCVPRRCCRDSCESSHWVLPRVVAMGGRDEILLLGRLRGRAYGEHIVVLHGVHELAEASDLAVADRPRMDGLLPQVLTALVGGATVGRERDDLVAAGIRLVHV